MLQRLSWIISLFLFLLLTPQQILLADEVKVLKIAGWDVYADPDNPHKTIGYKSFEKKYGVSIEFKPLSNLDDIIETAESSEKYGVFIISNEGISVLYDMNLIKPLTLKLLPHYQSLHPNLKYTAWSQFKGKTYAVPWAWGPTGLMYNKDKVDSPDSWNVLWDKRYKGHIAMWDDVSMIWTTALSLGYKNVYNLTKSQLEEVKNKLFKFNDLQAYYYKGGGDEFELAKKGKLTVYNSWYDPSTRLKDAGKSFGMIIPKEGAVGMFDSYLLSTHCKSKELAHSFINHQISPEVQQEMLRVTGLAPANIETLALLKPEEIKGLHLDEEDYFNRMILWNHMPRKNLYEKVLQEVREDYKKKLKFRK